MIAGLIGGGCIGYVLGKESPRRCESCQANTESRYMAGFQAGARIGHKDGYCDGVEATVALVKKRGAKSVQAWDGREVWNIGKNELERIREDAVGRAYV